MADSEARSLTEAFQDEIPAFYRQIGYDQKLEAEALAHLDELDLKASRRAFSRLVRNLDLSAAGGGSGQARQLLCDVLQKVNRRLHRTPRQEWLYQRNRIELIERFSSLRETTRAPDVFLSALGRLLAPFRGQEATCHRLVRQARAFIDRSYDRRISLSVVARDLAVSPNYLSRLFRRETGTTLTAYVQRVRLNHALRLLAEPGPSISEIAYRVGYRTYRDFHRNFVKYESASPRQVRRRLVREEIPPLS